MSGVQWEPRILALMDASRGSSKTILITGATDGIGLQTAIDCAAEGHRIFVHGRSAPKAQGACDTVRRSVPSALLQPVAGDLGSFNGVRAIADAVRSATPVLHVLVNNAGVYMKERVLSFDGIEMTMAVNHFAHFLLTHLMLDLLRAGAPSRVVTVSSIAHTRGAVDPVDATTGLPFDPYGAYARSKLANVLFSNALARRINRDGISSNALHPGVISTKLLRAGFNMSGASVKEGASTSVHLALSPEVSGVTGRYFSDRREVRPSSRGLDVDLQDRLWDVSARLTGVVV